MTTQPQPEALRLANQLRDILPAFRTPSHERGVLNGAIQRLEQLHAECEALRMERDALRAATGGRMGYFDDEVGKLHAECEALRATQSDTLLRLLCDLRFALGDNGARMQHDLVEYARGLRADAERYRELRRQHEESDSGITMCVFEPINHSSLEPVGCMPGELDAAIDAARAAKEQSK